MVSTTTPSGGVGSSRRERHTVLEANAIAGVDSAAAHAPGVRIELVGCTHTDVPRADATARAE